MPPHHPLDPLSQRRNQPPRSYERSSHRRHSPLPGALLPSCPSSSSPRSRPSPTWRRSASLLAHPSQPSGTEEDAKRDDGGGTVDEERAEDMGAATTLQAAAEDMGATMTTTTLGHRTTKAAATASQGGDCPAGRAREGEGRRWR